MTLRLEEAAVVDGRLPFDCRVEGFDRGWWCEGRVIRGRRYLSVFLGDEEVARAEVDPQSQDVGEDPDTNGIDAAVKIEFFEVRESFRGSQLGREAVDLVVNQFDGMWIVALSANVGGFWRALGWSEAVSQDAYIAHTFRYLRAPPATS